MDNKFVEEDWEKLQDLEQIYLEEKNYEMWEEYCEWMEQKNRLPAIIELIIPEKLNHEYVSGGNRKIKATNKEL